MGETSTSNSKRSRRLKGVIDLPIKETGIFHLNHIWPGQRGRERTVLCRSPLRPGHGPVRNGVGHSVRGRPQPGDTCRNCGDEPLRSRMWNCEKYTDTPEAPRVMRGWVSIVTDGRNGVDVYLALRLNGKGVYRLLDTECDTSVVNRRVATNVPLKPPHRNYTPPTERR